MLDALIGTVELVKLSIKAKDDPSKEFKVLINPDSITNRININYHVPERQGAAEGQQLQFNNTSPEEISFSLIFDGTGATGEKIDVQEKIDELKDVVVTYASDKHEPNVVIVTWGTMVLESRLKSLDINYTLFKPNGNPLRAKLNLSFMKHTAEAEAERRRNSNSPDLSHVRTVKSGDTLPLMCQKIYGDSSTYLEVARVNGLTNFRNLKEGTEILFPPIKE